MAASTWTWIGTTGSADIASNWTLTGGPGNLSNFPIPGDTAIIAAGTAIFLDPSFTSGSVIDLEGSGGLQLIGDNSVTASATIDATSIIDASGPATSIQLSGALSNAGTIAVTGTNDSLSITIAADGSIFGVLSNAGEITVGQNDTLTITGTGDLNTNTGSLDVAGGLALIASPLTGLGAYAVSAGGTLEFDQPNTGASAFVDLASGAGTVRFDRANIFNGSITVRNFVIGDRIDLGAVTVASAIYGPSGDLELVSSDGITDLFRGTVVGQGGTLFQQGSFAIGATGGIAGGLRIVQGPGSDALLLVQAPSTWSWFGGSGSASSPANWALTAGPGNASKLPGPTDTELINSGTVQALDVTLSANTLVIGNATAQFVNDTASLIATFDAASVIENAASAASATLQVLGLLLNDGTISAATASGVLAIQAQPDGGLPGLFVNNGEIAASNGATLTIGAGANASFANAGTVLANNGVVRVGGSVAPANGVWEIENGGTLEVGALPAAANILFAGTSATLGLDNLPGASARILGLQSGNTIDLGKTTVDSLIYDSAGSVLTLINAGSAIATLNLASDGFQSGSFIVSGGTAGSFEIGTNVAGDTLLTTPGTNTTWNFNSSGDWSTAPNWSHGVPGSNDTAVISPGTLVRTITVGSAVSAGAAILDDSNTTLSIGQLLNLQRGIDDIGGGISITAGASLIAQAVREVGAASSIGFTLASSSGVVVLTGATDPGNASPVAIIDSVAVTLNGGMLDAGGRSVAGTTGGFISVGENDGGAVPSASPTMSVASGAGVLATYTRLGSGPLSAGTLSISGFGTSYDDVGDPTDTANPGGDMLVGTGGGSLAPSGTATLIVGNNATLTEAGFAMIGAASGSTGTASVSGGALWNIGEFLGVGDFGSGSLIIDTGTVAVGGGGTIIFAGTTAVVSDAIDIGVQAGIAGAVTITNAGASLIAAADIRVGDQGVGRLIVTSAAGVHASTNLDVSGQGRVSAASGGSIVADANINVSPGSTISVDAASAISEGGSTLVVGNIAIDSGHTLAGAGMIASAVVDGGQVVAASGTLEIVGSVTGGGTLSIGSGATLRLDALPATAPTVVFASGAPEALVLSAPGTAFVNSILDLAGGDVIELGGLSITGATVSNGTITVSESLGHSYRLTNVAVAAGASQAFITGHDPVTGNDFIQVACFRIGTRIATACGETPVEALRIGDRVRTVLPGGLQDVTWIGRRRIDCRRHARPELVRPVRIRANAFGVGMPRRDLWLSPDHALYLDEVLIPVKHLVNGASIEQVALDTVEYYHVALARHGVLLAEDMPAESYLETDERTAARVWEAEGCAPLRVAGHTVEAVRRRLDRAA